MSFTGYPILMDPVNLIQNGLLGNHLDVFIDRSMQIISLFRRSYLRDSCRHVSRIDRHTLKAVFAAKLVLIVHFKAIEAYEFLFSICKRWISIFCFISLSDRVIPFQIGR
ncbi:hypothetical protein D3C78_1375040 [compost metagenome]